MIKAEHAFVKRVVHSVESEDGGEERNGKRNPDSPEPQPRITP